MRGKAAGLVVIGDRPLVAETPESLLDDDTTPTARFFIRNNGLLPERTRRPEQWKITIDGEVEQPLSLTLAELKSNFKPVTRRLLIECGGNGRAFFSPRAKGVQWTHGGAGCPEWTGVRLADVLEGCAAQAKRGIQRSLRRRSARFRQQQKADNVARRSDQEAAR